jgi:manganese oxidase
MFHAHHDEMTQIALGQTGMIVVHPRETQGPPPDRDFAIMLHEYRIRVGTSRPDPNEMTEFNVLTMNGKCFPATGSLVVKKNDRVRIRIANLGPMDHHPIHLHGYYFRIVETDGGPIPPAAQWPETTVLVAVGQTRTVELVADEPGDWALHCHMTHHVMNQMGHGLPNMIGVNTQGLDARVRPLLPDYMTMGQDGMGEHGKHVEMGHMQVPPNSIPMVGGQGPFDYISMGGMFTVMKVREQLANYDEDPGWFEHPTGTVAERADEAELRRDLGPGPAAG